MQYELDFARKVVGRHLSEPYAHCRAVGGLNPGFSRFGCAHAVCATSVMERTGIEPVTSGLQSRRSPS